MTELIVRFGIWTGTVSLGDKPVVIGRADDCDVQVPDAHLSRHHCRVGRSAEGGWQVEDLGSRGGTLVDGVPVVGAVRLKPDSRIGLGRTEIGLTSAPAHRMAADTAKIRLLLETVGQLYENIGLDELLRTVVDRAVLVAGADRGALLLASADGTLEAAVARHSEGRDLKADQVLTRSLPQQVLESGRAVVLTDVEATGQRERTPGSVLNEGLESVLCVPMPGARGPVGVLYVDAYQPAVDFGQAELVVLEALAVQAALAIERARLRQEQVHREAQARQVLEAENARLRAGLPAVVPMGESPAMLQTLDLIRRVASSEATVCLTGETGTGKEVLARYLHQLSPRARGPFIVVDCGALPESLIESELFGHEQGAFTGASHARPGRFREASGGTVLLDEVAELPLSLQMRLLRVLQERTVQSVGGLGRTAVDVRVICATHQDLARKVENGSFRQDLFYRMAVLSVTVPSLRQRGQDILLLARHFLLRESAHRREVHGFTRDAVQALLEHPWPGNVRELEHRVQRAVLLATPPFVTRQDLGLGEDSAAAPPPQEAQSPLPQLPEARAQAYQHFERAYLEEALQRAAGNVSHTARLAGVSRQRIQSLLQKHGIDPRRFTARP